MRYFYLLKRSVVFPAPFGPSRARISPFLTLRDVFESAENPLSYVFDSSLISRMLCIHQSYRFYWFLTVSIMICTLSGFASGVMP